MREKVSERGGGGGGERNDRMEREGEGERSNVLSIRSSNQPVKC